MPDRHPALNEVEAEEGNGEGKRENVLVYFVEHWFDQSTVLLLVRCDVGERHCWDTFADLT